MILLNCFGIYFKIILFKFYVQKNNFIPIFLCVKIILIQFYALIKILEIHLCGMNSRIFQLVYSSL